MPQPNVPDFWERASQHVVGYGAPYSSAIIGIDILHESVAAVAQ